MNYCVHSPGEVRAHQLEVVLIREILSATEVFEGQELTLGEVEELVRRIREFSDEEGKRLRLAALAIVAGEICSQSVVL